MSHATPVAATPVALLDQIAGAAQVVVRHEEWLVRSVQQTPPDRTDSPRLASSDSMIWRAWSQAC